MKEAMLIYEQSLSEESKEEHGAAIQELLKGLHGVFSGWVDETLEHLLNEEGTVTVAARKHLSIERQVEIVKAVYDDTAGDRWTVIFPYVVMALPHPMWKVRYVQCFLWAVPYRAEEIGMALFRGCDDVTWQFLCSQLPEIVPRGLPGYRRTY